LYVGGRKNTTQTQECTILTVAMMELILAVRITAMTVMPPTVLVNQLLIPMNQTAPLVTHLHPLAVIDA